MFGLLGLMMRRFGLPVLPLIIRVILGPRIERQLRQSLQLGAGEWSSLFHEPIAIIAYIGIAALFAVPLVMRLVNRRRAKGPQLDTAASAAEKEKAQA